MTVADGAALTRVLHEWLTDSTERARIGERGRRVVESNRGALDRLIALVEERLGTAA